MNRDLTGLLEEWPYDPEGNTRIVTANDGRKVLQVRLPLGIEQYELVGRPDGERPFGKDTILEEMESRVAEYVLSNGTDDGFLLSHEDCELLQSEAILFYYRYLLLFQINDYDRVAADTEHNLRMCRLFERYCDREEDRESVLQYKPYIVRMNSMARAMRSMKQGAHEKAAGIIDRAIGEIENMAELDSPAFQFERVRSINYLKSALKQLDSGERGSHRSLETTLKQELDEAVREENYERAAELRDRIRTMRSSGPER
ncbi:MAG: UvrB/UvrC motif-containing protein [Spirochaetales bacterium]